MSEFQYDIIIIGAGPSGYVAAERAGAAGKKVLLIEKSFLGGVCLNCGCIPSKTLLHSANVFQLATHSSDYGVEFDGAPRFNLAAVMTRKKRIIETLRKGVSFQMKHHKVEVIEGEAHIAGPNAVQVGGNTYSAPSLIVATGSSPVIPPIPGADQPHVLTSTGILEINALPTNLVIIGGGVIGMEFACFFKEVGVNVTVIEMLPEILPGIESELARQLRKALPVTYKLGAQVTAISSNAVEYTINESTERVDADMVLMAVGRRPNTANLGLDTVGVDIARTGVRVNEQMETNIPGIYAVGDVNGLSPLAHSASRMGEVAVNTILGKRDRMRLHAIPGVVYTHPEVAAVGMSADTARDAGYDVEEGEWQMRANGRFLAEHDHGGGVCKVVVDTRSRRLLGVHIIGAHASEIIYGAAAMIEGEFRVDDIKEIVFPHPTVSEVFRDSIFQLNL